MVSRSGVKPVVVLVMLRSVGSSQLEIKGDETYGFGDSFLYILDNFDEFLCNFLYVCSKTVLI